MTEVERRARLICQALHGIDPETQVFSRMPSSVGGMFIATPSELIPLWKCYLRPAQMLIADEERRAEEGEAVSVAGLISLLDRYVPGYGRVMVRLWPDELTFWAGGKLRYSLTPRMTVEHPLDP